MAIVGVLWLAVAMAQTNKDLGQQSADFGSSRQAQEVLRMIQESPGQGGYQISYRTAADVVIFGCDLNRDTVVRIHQRPSGGGSGERWQGHALYRLQSAAQGGSLNDTPNGKSPAIMERF